MVRTPVAEKPVGRFRTRGIRPCHRCGEDSQTQVRWPRSGRWYNLCPDHWLDWWVWTKVVAALQNRLVEFADG